MYSPGSKYQVLKATKDNQHFLVLLFLVGLYGCDDSPLGPSINDREKATTTTSTGTPTTTVVASTTTATTTATAQTTTTAEETTTTAEETTTTAEETTTTAEETTTPTTTTVTCNRATGHNIYYGSSTVSLSYTCDSSITAITETSMPSFLTSSVSGQTVTFTGTAPTTASENSWSFSITGDNITAAGNATSITTNILARSSITQSVATSLSLPSYNTATDFALTATIDSSWDGSSSDLSLALSSIDTDMHGLTYVSSCDSGSDSYICPDPSVSSTTLNAGLTYRWKYGAFDQGTYYIKVTPSITIESAATTMTESSALTFSVPIQTGAGANPKITPSDSPANAIYDDKKYVNRSFLGAGSTATNPEMGMVYFGNGKNTYMRLANYDRTKEGTDTSNFSSYQVKINSENSSFYTLRPLSTTSWALLGVEDNDNSHSDITFNKATDDNSSLTAGTSILLTSHGGTYFALDPDLSGTFTDTDSTTRMGFVYVRKDDSDNYRLIVSKLNPAGTNQAGIIDDSDCVLGGTPGYSVAGGGAGWPIDQTRIETKSESSTNYLYVAFRNTTNDSPVTIDIQGIKLDADCNASATATISTSVLNDAAHFADTTMDMILGEDSSSNTVMGVVYNKSNNRCYFRRIDQSLSTTSTEIELTTTNCKHPNIHFNSTTKRFLVTAYVYQADSNYNIQATEITMDSAGNDTFSSWTTIVEDVHASSTITLDTIYYEAAQWIGITYRAAGADIYFHGYHPSSQ